LILGVGTDLVENRRLEAWLTQPRLLEKYFSPEELRDVHESGHPAASLAARFAAKEAFGKALGTGLHGLRLKDVAIYRHPGGQPALALSGTALEAVQARGGRVHVSLSHERDYSLAFVVLEV